MNITIIGGTKGIGKEVIKQALANGHNVTVLARNPDKVEIINEMLNIVKGDFLWKI